MRRAIALSRRGLPAPNPHVGCVIVKDGEAVGEGFHRYYGELHAEAAALREAGDRARGAEVFCTLEPCNHQGKQPPCAEALIAAGVKRVWYACADPNPRVTGGGAEALRRAGIEVASGLLEAEAERIVGPWLTAMKRRRPFVTLKAAMTLDGRIALADGRSQWITGERTRAEARRLRAEMGAVLVGRGTVIADDPLLTARIGGLPREPWRFVLDPDRQVPDSARIFGSDGRGRRIVSEELARDGDLGVPVLDKRFELSPLLERLFEEGVTGLLVEGGSATLSGFLEEGLADRLDLFMGNAAFGAGKPVFAFDPPAGPESAPRWRLIHVRRRGEDVWIRYEPRA